MTGTRPGYSTAQLGGKAAGKVGDAASVSWVKNLAEVVNGILKGRQNVVLTITLAAGAAATVVDDARIGPFSGLFLQPMTSHAAAALYSATSVLVTDQKSGQATFSHANNAQTDKTFNLLIIG